MQSLLLIKAVRGKLTFRVLLFPGPKGIRTRNPSSKYARSYYYTTCVFMSTSIIVKTYTTSFSEAHLLPLHNV
jgi:hypothetical protein